MRIRSTLSFAAAAALVSVPAAAQDGPERDDSRYLYELTVESASVCSFAQNILAQVLTPTDAEAARQHQAISMTWLAIAEDMNGASLSDEELLAFWRPKIAHLTEESDPAAEMRLLSHPCEVMARLYSDRYFGTVRNLEEGLPELFADRAAFVHQAGGEYPDPPDKEMIYDEWIFVARGNSCQASPLTLEGIDLTFAFTNFFDGRITISSAAFPSADMDSDDYEAFFAPHRAGADRDEDFIPVMAEGLTYETYPGTALFVDGQLLGGPVTGAMTDPDVWVFGAGVQQPYYNLLPLGGELRVKVLGEEVHRIALPGPAFWNEMSNCMAQYPFG